MSCVPRGRKGMDITDDRIRIKGANGGLEEMHIGLTVGGKQMYFGWQSRHGDIGCGTLGKHETERVIKAMAEMHKKMKRGKE